MTLDDPEVSQVEIDRLLNRAKIAKKIDNLTPYIHMEACSTNEIWLFLDSNGGVGLSRMRAP